MKSIVFIVPYFALGNGKLPEMFKLWLASCANNPTINWYVITDCCTDDYDIPANVKIQRSTFNDVKNRIQSLFEFDIALNSPYKLCDFKPTYGEVFQDLIEGYDFWGFCDIDIIWGNIRKFITNEILENNDRILTRGHCSIFRNNFENNMRYRTLDRKGCLDYREVFSSDESYAFDEWAGHYGGGYSAIQKLNGISMYDGMIYADIQINRYQLHTTRERDSRFQDEKNNIRMVFVISNGMVMSKSIHKKSKQIIVNEYMYIHLQQRKLNVERGIDKNNYIIVPPNKAMKVELLKTKDDIIKVTRNAWWTWNIKGQIKEWLHDCKVILKNRTGMY